MVSLNGAKLDYRTVNRQIRECGDEVAVLGCLGQRFIAAGLSSGKIELSGTPGNALGAYLNGAEVVVRGNAQDAVGDTMNGGKIIVHGNIGDAAGYAMRGGSIFVRGSAGYRVGIHMKEYREKRPVMVIGGCCGSFLGEYQAGGLIVVLGLDCSGDIVGDFPCTGMHGGKMFLRSDCAGIRFPEHVTVQPATEEDLREIEAHLLQFCTLFDYDISEIKKLPFTKIVPGSKNPYQQMYVAN